jgi:NAD-dependent dihydropyrimidine dehydrogenase PreA subunit
MSFIIGSKCIGEKDGACITACPIDECIVEGQESMYINPELCIDCGACISECPVDAIYDSEEDAIANGELKAVHDNYNFFGFKFED